MTKRREEPRRAGSSPSDPNDVDLESMLNKLADQPREVRPKWTPQSAGMDRARYEGEAAPARVNRAAQEPDEGVVLRPSTVPTFTPGPLAEVMMGRPTKLVDRRAKRGIVVASVVGAGAVVIIVAAVVALRKPSEAVPRSESSSGALSGAPDDPRAAADQTTTPPAVQPGATAEAPSTRATAPTTVPAAASTVSEPVPATASASTSGKAVVRPAVATAPAVIRPPPSAIPVSSQPRAHSYDLEHP